LNLGGIPRLMVFNKMDLVSPDAAANVARMHGGVALSAHDRQTLQPLLDRLQDVLIEHNLGRVEDAPAMVGQ
jgi:50S ribosomal subunit-associated GTPase HflX